MLEGVVAPVLRDLTNIYPDLPPVMVVGAVCRDALHMSAGHEHPLRRTDDLDIGLAIGSWDHFHNLTGRLRGGDRRELDDPLRSRGPCRRPGPVRGTSGVP